MGLNSRVLVKMTGERVGVGVVSLGPWSNLSDTSLPCDNKHHPSSLFLIILNILYQSFTFNTQLNPITCQTVFHLHHFYHLKTKINTDLLHDMIRTVQFHINIYNLTSQPCKCNPSQGKNQLYICTW